tara:strand:- start:1249 stop:3570 length:2322 start_codon:yes stop_codon:yes gene_type:complete
MNKNILNRPMFQNRQQYKIGGGARILNWLKKPKEILKKPKEALTQFNRWDKGHLPDGSVPLTKKPRGITRMVWPHRKSLKTVAGAGYGLAGYNLLAPEKKPDEVVNERVVTDNNNIINKEKIINKANSLTDKLNNIKNDAVTAITGGDLEAEADGSETFEGSNQLSANMFASPNEDQVKVEEDNPENKMNMDLKISGLANGAANYAEQKDIEQIDMKKVEAIKEQLNELVGDPTSSDNINMLMQLGSSLMTGKTLRGGLSGFFDVAGQAGLQILPQMLAISDRKNTRDQELALAAFQLVQEANNQDDAFGPGKGTMIYPHQISYKMKEDGSYELDENNQYIPIGYTPVGSGFGFSKDFQSKGMMDVNSVLTAKGLPPLYTLLDAATTGESGAFGAFGEGEPGAETGSQRDEAEKYSRVLERGLPDIANMLSYITTYNPNGTFNSDKYIGPLGIAFEKTREFLAPWEQIASMAPWMGNDKSEVMGSMAKNYQEAFKQIDNYWMQNMQTDNGRLVDVESLDKLNNDGTFTDRDGIYAGQTYTFRDEGGNLRTGQTQAGNIYETPLSLKLKIGAQSNPWDNSNIGLMEQYKNQIGMVVARYKQPTGRLLADTIKDSKDDIDLTKWQNPVDLVNKQFRYFKNFLTDWSRNLEAANTKVTSELIDKRFGAPDGSGGGLSLLNKAIMSYNMWGQIKEAQNKHSILPATDTWIKLPGLIYPGAPKEGGGAYNTEDIRGFFTNGLQSGSFGIQEDVFGSDMDPNMNVDDYISDYFESLEIQ